MDDYRTAPFWFLNHLFEKTELLPQLKLMAEQGIKAFFLHPRPRTGIPGVSAE